MPAIGASVKARLFHSSSFCCCIPVRAGVVFMSILTLLLSGAISIIIWYEVFHSYQFSTRERAAFILAGIVESILFCVSMLGIIGVVARKQLFVMVYTYFLYIHFVLNLAVGIYFLVIVRESNRQQLVDYCWEVFADTSADSTCSRLMSVSTYVFITIVGALLLLELYGVLIATRYVYRLRMQKRDDRSRRLAYFHALPKPETWSTGHSRQASDNIELLHPQNNIDDLQDLEGNVFDIRPPSYVPVLAHDHDFPAIVAPSPPFSLDGGSSHRPRPMSTGATKVASSLPERATEFANFPNPHERATGTSRPQQRRRSLESEDGRHSPYTVELSTNAHIALMDHAGYMESRFSSWSSQ